MKLQVTPEEKIRALESIGYVVKLETVTNVVNTGSYDITREVELYNVYLNGTEMVSSGIGLSRVDYIFSVELGRRLLGLFR